MSDDESISVVNLGKLAKSAETLIQKVSAGAGIFFEPSHIRRKAKADSDALLIKTVSEIASADLQRRALQRSEQENAIHQKNMESITDKAIPLLEANSDAGRMEDDWVVNFFSRSRLISDPQMQELWAAVLAGEANSPGIYSKRTVNFLGDMDKDDAKLFESLRSFCWEIGTLEPVILDLKPDNLYSKHGLTFDGLTHLASIGLIALDLTTPSFARATSVTSYEGRRFRCTFNNSHYESLHLGHALFTRTGRELARVIPTTPVDGFVDYVSNHWSDYGIIIEELRTSPASTQQQ